MTANKKTPNWRWVWRNAADAALFDPAPEVVTADAVCVKNNPVRSVWRRNGCYLKFETPERTRFFRRASKAETEYRQSLALELAGVPVVEALGYGECGKDSILVTRAFPESVSVTEYWCTRFVRDGEDPGAFLAAYAAFLKVVFRSGFFHPDFHNGNILYQPETGKFALVDVYGVRRICFWTAGRFIRMARIVAELREVLADEACVRLLIEAGISSSPAPAQRMWRSVLRYEQKRIARELPRRLKQLFADYPKFILRDGDWSWTLDATRKPWATAAEIEEGKYEAVAADPAEIIRLRREDFIQTLAFLPHRRVVAYNHRTETLYCEFKGE